MSDVKLLVRRFRCNKALGVPNRRSAVDLTWVAVQPDVRHRPTGQKSLGFEINFLGRVRSPVAGWGLTGIRDFKPVATCRGSHYVHSRCTHSSVVLAALAPVVLAFETGHWYKASNSMVQGVPLAASDACPVHAPQKMLHLTAGPLRRTELAHVKN